MLQHTPWLIAMLVLVFCSAFFSSSEAAFFYLRRADRRRMASGNRPQRIAAHLLADPDRLLTAVLFWNLVVNVAYFTIASILSLAIEETAPTHAWLFAAGSLLLMIICSEMLPKSLAVLRPRTFATLFGIPLAGAIRVLDPVIPIFRTTVLLSRRLFCPRFKPEEYLHVSDLERAVELSTSDAELLEHEQKVLQNIVQLSETRVDELMRPRIQFLSFRPPVALADLEGRVPPSGYLLVTEPESDEVAGAIALENLSEVPTENLELHADPVVYVPWCASAAAALESMESYGRRVAAIVNELGETVGILTFDDLLDTIFSRTPSRSEWLLQREPLRKVAENLWHVTGMTSLRWLAREMEIDRTASKSVTVAGVVGEQLERLPRPGDVCDWGPLRMKVLEVPDRGQLLVEVTRTDEKGDAT